MGTEDTIAPVHSRIAYEIKQTRCVYEHRIGNMLFKGLNEKPNVNEFIITVQVNMFETRALNSIVQ